MERSPHSVDTAYYFRLAFAQPTPSFRSTPGSPHVESEGPVHIHDLVAAVDRCRLNNLCQERRFSWLLRKRGGAIHWRLNVGR